LSISIHSPYRLRPRRCRLGGGAEAGQQIVVDGNRLLAAAKRAEPDSLVAERPGDLFAQCRLGGGAEAGEQIVVDGNLLLATAELAERDPLVDERPGDLFAQCRLGGGAEAGRA